MSPATPAPATVAPAHGGEASATFEDALRALRTEQRNVALPGLALTYLGLAALLPLAGHLDTARGYALLAVPIGLLQYRVTLSGHEAVHRTLCFPGWLNETLGVLGQALVGVNFASYRVQHLDHHRATTLADDPDGHIYGGIVGAPRGWRRTLTWTLGTLVELVIKIWQKGLGSIGRAHAEAATVRTVAYSRACSVAVLVAQAGLVALCWRLTGRWYGYALLWIGPLFVVAVFLNRSRILVEHGLALLLDVPPVTRSIPTVDIVPPAWERMVFAPFLFNYHCSHHLFLTVPHYNLPKLRALLKQHGVRGHHEVEGSYLQALARAMRA